MKQYRHLYLAGKEVMTLINMAAGKALLTRYLPCLPASHSGRRAPPQEEQEGRRGIERGGRLKEVGGIRRGKEVIEGDEIQYRYQWHRESDVMIW